MSKKILEDMGYINSQITSSHSNKANVSIGNEAVERLSRDLAKAGSQLSDDEVRFMVDSYYTAQADRIRTSAQVRELSKSGKPNELLKWLSDQSSTLEKQIVRALDHYTENHVMGSWMRDIYGIGPIISAGLLANISMTHWKCINSSTKSCKPENPCTVSCKYIKVETVGHIWRYAGLDPTVKWEKGKRRPWNATLKRICFLIGQSFLKFSNNPKCFYGHIYLDRKKYEMERNDRGDNKELALSLAEKYRKTTDAYKHLSEGKLPPAQIDARARRYAVKIFLSHMHAEWYRREFKEEPPKPFAIAILGHAHMIHPQDHKERT